MDFEKNPVIAAVRTDEQFKKALISEPSCIFLLNSDMLSLKERLGAAHEHGKSVFVHVDFTDGLGRDKVGMALLSQMGADGIITTRANIVKLAHEAGLKTVQRFFIVDSHSTDTAMESIRSAHPDMIEVMPALVTREIARFCQHLKIPVIAGGLLETRADIYAALSAGAWAVSAGNAELWQ